MQYKQYFIGDSHFTDFYMTFAQQYPELEWKTILSPGFQRLVRQNLRAMSDAEVNHIWNIFDSLEKGSRIFLSCTDIDSRAGSLGFEEHLEKDYFHVFKKISEITETKDIIVLDWFSIENRHVAEQQTTVEQRVNIRKNINNILQKLKNENIIKDFHTTFMNPEIDNEHGVCIDSSIVRDGVHYNFTNEKIKNILLPILRNFINQER